MTGIFGQPRSSATALPRAGPRAFTALLLAFPFLVLFSPRIPLLVTHARIDELLVAAWLPVALRHYGRPTSDAIRRRRSPYFLAFLSIFVVFVIGLVLGDGAERWSQPNLKMVSRPLFVLIDILVLRYWIHRSQCAAVTAASALVSAVAVAGGLGYLALSTPALAAGLTSVYASALENVNDAYRFDMSRRAMSVFAGYDQASVTYAAGALVSLALFLDARTFRARALSSAAGLWLIVSIVTSARTGFVSLVLGGMKLLAMRRGGHAVVAACAAARIGALAYVVVPSIIPNEATLEHFADIKSLIDVSSPLPFWERSEGVNALIESQVIGIEYPSGMDCLLGRGDTGMYISDSAYVTIYVTYGLVGVAVIAYALFAIARQASRTGRSFRAAVGSPRASVSSMLPAMVALFAVASAKGGLYLLTYKTGELFAVLLAYCVVEAEGVPLPKARDGAFVIGA